MPLIKGDFKGNVAREKAAGKPIRQALAIAYDVERRAKGTASGRVGSAGYVNHPSYTGSAPDKSEQTKDTRHQTGTKPTHDGGGNQDAGQR